VYVVRVKGDEVTLPAENVLHIAGFSLDGCTGLIPTTLAKNAIGLARATEDFGSSFFGNGAAPSGVLSHPAKLGKEATDNLRASWSALYSGLTNAQRIAILEEGMTWTPLGVPPEHAQFLETRRFQVSEIARVFLIPPHLIGDLDRATFSNIEQQSIEYVTYCILPWARRIEQELNYRLFNDRSQFAEFVLDGLLRGDSASRAAFYTSMSNIGALSINEIREMENLNRIEGGDIHRVPLNTAPLGTPPEDTNV
jgi:HK97 family phage portal protein